MIIFFNFREECTKMYLEKRSRFRRTGVIEKDPYYKVSIQFFHLFIHFFEINK